MSQDNTTLVRQCKPYASPSTPEEIEQTRTRMDEEGIDTFLVYHASALIRSNLKRDVNDGLDYLKAVSMETLDPKLQQTVAFLTTLALYRLGRDSDLMKYVETVRKTVTLSKETQEMYQELEREKQVNTAAGVAAAAGIVAVGASVLALIFGRKRK